MMYDGIRFKITKQINWFIFIVSFLIVILFYYQYHFAYYSYTLSTLVYFIALLF